MKRFFVSHLSSLIKTKSEKAKRSPRAYQGDDKPRTHYSQSSNHKQNTHPKVKTLDLRDVPRTFERPSTTTEARPRQNVRQPVPTQESLLAATHPPSHSNAQSQREVQPLAAGSQCFNYNCPLLFYYRTRATHIATARYGLPASIDWKQGDRLASLPQTPLADVYKSLAPWQTRLVELLPFTTDSALLQLRLFCVDFADMQGVGVTGTSEVVTYTALSHVWGTSNEQTFVICNGLRVAISTALAESLSFLAEEGNEKYLWVDSLCINQLDALEKSKQVRDMLRIFEKADKVIAWIENFKLVKNLPLLKFVFDCCHDRGHAHECLEAWQSVRRDLLCLASDDLWTRTWCRQEIFAARLVLLRGPEFGIPRNLDLDEFAMVLRQWIYSQRPDLSLPGQTQFYPGELAKGLVYRASSEVPAAFITMANSSQHAGTDRYSYKAPSEKIRYSIHWLRHLRGGARLKVSDERDRVYGLFGMISSPSTRWYVEDKPEIQPKNFPISYDKTISEVYQDVVKFLINTDKNLDCLTVFENRRTRSKSNDLPSWVTDWRCDQPRTLLNCPPDQITDVVMYGTPIQQSFDDIAQLRLHGSILFPVKELSSRHRVDFDVNTGYSPGDHLAPGQNVPLHKKGTLYDGELDHDTMEISPWYMTSKYEHCNCNGTEIVLHDIYVPHNTRIDDLVVRLHGGRLPFVLRSHDNGTYELVGPAIFPSSMPKISRTLNAKDVVTFVLV